MKNIPYDLWQAVIGLEVHVQLNTKSKLFSHAPNRFGDEPNTNITEVCTGEPGALPVLNEEAVKKAVLFGLAIHAEVARISTFDRKSYFYPDSPRNFQITQFEHPILKGGTIIANVEGKTKEFQVNRAHLEDDAGMLKHFSTFGGIDFNRAGVPLLEVVSEPSIHSAKEAVAYVMALKAIMEYIDASDCNMDEGSLRVDANVSVRPKNDSNLRTKIEIKNMNSFHFLELAIESEIERQILLYTQNPNEDPKKIIHPSTYRFDPEQKKTILMRGKESAEDYRYFPEPDLVPIVLNQEFLLEMKKSLPELPHERFKRYVTSLGLTEYSASQLINEKRLADYFEEALSFCPNGRSVCNWMTIEFMGRLKEKGETLFSLKIPPVHLAKLVTMIDEGKITGKIAKSVADDMIQHPQKDPLKIVQENPSYQPILDEKLIESIVDEVLKENPLSVADYKNGKTKAFGFLVGQVMKKSKGQASPDLVNEYLKRKMKET
jgi:aspartyl-tRNA(Asn)/glutamyl-tRNA(Gln) amidotransferase subunit B